MSKERISLRAFRKRFSGKVLVIPPQHESMMNAFFADYYVAGKFGHSFDVWCFHPYAVVSGLRAVDEGPRPDEELLARYKMALHAAAGQDMKYGTNTQEAVMRLLILDVLGPQGVASWILSLT